MLSVARICYRACVCALGETSAEHAQSRVICHVNGSVAAQVLALELEVRMLARKHTLPAHIPPMCLHVNAHMHIHAGFLCASRLPKLE